MKNIAILFIALFCMSASPNNTCTISINVEGLDVKNGGDLVVKLFVKEGFPYAGKEVAKKSIKVTDNKGTIRFTDFKPGTYAAAVYQDENSDGELNTNFIGIPNEPAAFSKNKMGKMGPPDFEDVCFTVKAGSNIDLTVYL